MTKLQSLNVYFTERLMAVAQEILQVVGETVTQYQEETDRAKRENESLRWRLREAGLYDETGLTKSSRHPPPLSEQQEWISTGQDTDSTLTAVKLEFTEPQRNRQEEEEHRRPEEEEQHGPEPGVDGAVIPSPCSKRECDLNQATFPSPCGKRDRKRDSQNHPDLKLQIGNTEEEEPVPDVTHYQIKTETDGGDCDPSEQPMFIDVLNPASQTLQSESSGPVNEDVSSRPMLLSADQHSKEKQSVVHGESSLSCVYCAKVFIHVSRLKAHLRTHTEEHSFRSQSEQSPAPHPSHAVSLEASARANGGSRGVLGAEPAGRVSQCEAQLPPEALDRLGGLGSHLCPQCGKAFRHMSQVRRHMRMHTGEKPFCCPVCEKCFKYSGNLKEHQIVHTGEKPHRCPVCGRCFGKSAHLQRHLRIHTGEKPYMCPVCGRCFTQSGVMKRHLQVHNSFTYT